jgi:hypothetical protein
MATPPEFIAAAPEVTKLSKLSASICHPQFPLRTEPLMEAEQFAIRNVLLEKPTIKTEAVNDIEAEMLPELLDLAGEMARRDGKRSATQEIRAGLSMQH